MARDRLVQVSLIVVLLLAAASRLVTLHALHIPERYTFDESGYLLFDGEKSDEREYEGRGWNLTQGKNFWALPSGDGNAPPGLPLWVWLVYSVLGRHPYALLLANGLFGALAAYGTFRLGRRVLPEPAAVGAALGVALDPQLVFWSIRILTEPPSVVMAVLATIAIIRVSDRPTRKNVLLTGLALAAGVLLRTNFVVFLLAGLVWLAFTARPRARTTFAVLAVFLALYSPLAWLTLINRDDGKGNQVQQLAARGVLLPAYHEWLALERARRSSGGELTEAEEARVRERARTFIATHSGARVQIVNMGLRARTLWNVIPTKATGPQKWLYTVHAIGLFGLAAVGAALSVRRDRVGRIALLFVFAIAGLTLLHSLVIARPRYRILIQPMLWILAFHALVWIQAKLKPRRRIESA